ncbi:quinic acid utilization activator [Fusarium pseudocircinatum]|uniref:Quinic acid utilization activator n=1 Tax=Fusarium pseudocircinatum TaxID=56676 RepID=A0A8H5LEX9_9HYPO|nr:quinic acid utilization activator [Fusarium pseudocircinatum]
MESPAKPKRTRVNKHKRVSRACNYCRARKHRCDGSHPTCSRCSAIHYPCSYGPDSKNKKRGLTTGYARALELLWALVFTVVPNSKAVVQELLPDIQFALDPRSRLVLNSRLVRDYETLRQAWDGSDIQEELDQLLSNIQRGDDSGVKLATSVKGETSTPEPVPPIKAFEAVQTSTPANDPIDTNMANASSTHHASMLQAAPWNGVSSPASAEHVRRFIDIYFAHTNCWLPIVPKHKMLELLYSPSRDDQAEAGNMATLWAIVAYTSLQDTRNHSRAFHNQSVLPAPEIIYLQARQQIPNEDVQLPGYVQALLILGLFKMDQEDLVSSWHLIGQAVRICLHLGIATSTSNGSSAANVNDDDQKRLLLSCFILDTLVSCRLRKPPHLRTGDLCFSPKLAETGPNEWEPQNITSTALGNTNSMNQPSRVLSIFNCYASLICILNDAMSSQRSPERPCTKGLLALNHWYDGLPQHCQISPLPGKVQSRTTPHLTPQLYNLHLAFASTEMHLRSHLAATNRLPSTQNTGLAGLSMGYLMAAFVKEFGVANMPAIFKIYQDLGRRRLLRLVRQDPSADLLVASESSPNLLPTPPEVCETGPVGTERPERPSAVSLTRQIEGSITGSHAPTPIGNLEEYDIETWGKIFGAAELAEAGIPTQQEMQSLDYLNGMTW